MGYRRIRCERSRLRYSSGLVAHSSGAEPISPPFVQTQWSKRREAKRLLSLVACLIGRDAPKSGPILDCLMLNGRNNRPTRPVCIRRSQDEIRIVGERLKRGPRNELLVTD